MDKEAICHLADTMEDRAFALACDIFDHPEIGMEEFHAVEVLTGCLEDLGFAVERGIADLPTAFRATWENGSGGVHIGILGEYDALANKGHACGHHLQTPAAIVALWALREALKHTSIPVKLTLYGTPGEEAGGGKVIMANSGYFRELDICLATHSCRKAATVSIGSLASLGRVVRFYGKSAHAAGSPWAGRSAMDAMLLTFQGLEFLREHIQDGCRIMYAIRQAIGPSNVVPQYAECQINVRAPDNSWLPELKERTERVIRGACLMTDTTCEIQEGNAYLARKPNHTLGDLCLQNYEALGIPVAEPSRRRSGGSSDVGNVSVLVPTVGICGPYVDAPSHSDAWVEGGKSEAARSCMRDFVHMLIAVSCDLICSPYIVKKAKEEFDTPNNK